MKTKFEVKAVYSSISHKSVDVSAEEKSNLLAGYRILAKNNAGHSWDFHGRDGSHGCYPFPFISVKELERKA